MWTFDPGGATASRIAMPHMLPSTVPSVSASAKFFLSWLNPPPHPITVYASHPPSPTTAQHSLPGGALPPYRGRSFTGRIASASPDAPELKYRPTETLPVPQRDVAGPARLCRPRRLASSPHWRKTRAFPGTKAKSGKRRTVCWREMEFELLVPRYASPGFSAALRLITLDIRIAPEGGHQAWRLRSGGLGCSLYSASDPGRKRAGWRWSGAVLFAFFGARRRASNRMFSASGCVSSDHEIDYGWRGGDLSRFSDEPLHLGFDQFSHGLLVTISIRRRIATSDPLAHGTIDFDFRLPPCPRRRGVTGRRVRSTMANNSCKAEEQLSYESRRLSRPAPAADHRGGGSNARGRARYCCAPPSPGSATAICISWRGCIPTRPLRARPRRRRGGGGGRRGRHLCEAGRPRHHLPVGVLRRPARNA